MAYFLYIAILSTQTLFQAQGDVVTILNLTFSAASMSNQIWGFIPDSPSYLSNPPPPPVMACSLTESIFGGPLLFGDYYYMSVYSTINAPPHYSLSFSFKLVLFHFNDGSWASTGTWLQLTFDTWSQALNQANGWNNGGAFATQTTTCGSSTTTEITVTSVITNHVLSSIHFQIDTHYTTAMDGLSWGLTAFYITYDNCDSRCSSCSGPLNTQCPTCSTGAYFLTLNSISYCLSCDNTCTSCSGPLTTDCTSCLFSERYLWNAIGGKGTCIYLCSNTLSNCKVCQTDTLCVFCNPGYYINNGACFPCGATCLSCDMATPSVCNSCYDGKYVSSGICYGCNSACKTCYGPSSVNCLSCDNTTALYQSQCQSQCPEGTVLNTTSRNCLSCALKCKTCSLLNLYQCYSCYDGFYFNSDDSGCYMCSSQCTTCRGSADFCLTCSDPSLLVSSGSCVTMSSCTSIIYKGNCLTECPYMTYYSEGTCVGTEVLGVNMVQIKQNTIYQLNFSSHWDYLFNQINSFVLISTNCSDSLTYTSQFLFSSSFANSYSVLIDYNQNSNISRKCQISFNITLNYNNSDGHFILETNYFTFPLLFSCPLDQYLSGTACVPKDQISFILEYDDTATRISLTLVKNYSLSLSVLNASLLISIQSYTQVSDYTYNLEFSGGLRYHIQFYYNTAIFNRPLLTVSIQLSLDLLLTVTNIIQNANNNQSITLLDDYNFGNFTDTVKKSGIAYNGMDLATSSSVLAVSFLKTKKIGNLMRSLMMVEIAFLIKYINLNYPENLRLFFIEVSKLVNEQRTIISKGYFGEKFEDKKQLPPLFLLYRASPYFLEMVGDMLIKLASYFVCGAASVCLFKRYMAAKRPANWKHKAFRFVLGSLCDSFVWQYIIVFFLTNHQQIFFYDILTLYAAPLGSFPGILNFSFSMLCLLLYVASVYLLFTIILQKHADTVNNGNRGDFTKIMNSLTLNKVVSTDNQNDDILSPPTALSPKTIMFETKNTNKTQIMMIKSTEDNEVKVANNNEKKKGNDDLNVKEPHQFIIDDIDEIDIENTQGEGQPKQEFNNRETPKLKILIGNDIIKKNVKPASRHESACKTNQIFPVKFDKNKKTKNDEITSPKSPKKAEKGEKPPFETLYLDFKTKKRTQSHFLIFDITRQCAIVLIVMFLGSFPFVQVLFINLVEWFFIVFAIKVKPFNNLISFGCFLGTEIFVCTIFICCFVLGIFDARAIRNFDDRIALGNAIINCNLIFRIWMIVMVIANSVLDSIRNQKEQKK